MGVGIRGGAGVINYRPHPSVFCTKPERTLQERDQKTSRFRSIHEPSASSTKG